MIRAVCFDAGGVLHTSSKDEEQKHFFAKASLAALEKCGINLGATPDLFLEKVDARAKEYKKWSEETTRELSCADIWNKYFLKDFSPDPAKVAQCAEYLCYLWDARKSVITPRAHLLETIKTLCQMGLKQGIISNIISTDFVPECLKRYGIEPFIEKNCVIMSSKVGRRKPAFEIFKAAIDALNLEAGEIVFVGDRLSRDVIGAKKANLGCMIQIRHGPSIEKDRAFESLGYKPDVVIDDLAEIPAIIEKLNQGVSHG
jgi:putative hydrolase of the HAD superfamily